MAVGVGMRPGGVGAALLPSLEELLHADGLILENRAADLAATLSTGGTVTSWASRVNGHTASGGNGPTFREVGDSTLSDGRAAVRFATQYLSLNAELAAAITSTTPITITATVRIEPANGSANNVVGFGQASSSTVMQCEFSSGTATYWNGGFLPAAAAQPLAYNDQDALVEFGWAPGGTSFVSVNGKVVGSLSLGASSTWTHLLLGGVRFNGNPVNLLKADMGDVVIHAGVRTAAQRAATALHLRATAMLCAQPIFCGDSIPKGELSGSYSCFTASYSSASWASGTPYALYAVVVNGGSLYECVTAGTSAGSGGPTGTGDDITDNTAHWRWLNYTYPLAWVGLASGNYTRATGIMRAVAGQVLKPIPDVVERDQFSHIGDDITDHDDGLPRVIFLWFRNESTFGVSDADTLQRWRDVVAAILADNPTAYIVVCTPLPGDDVETGGVRALLLEHGSEFADAVLDLGGCPGVQDPTDTDMYSDGIHPTARAQSRILWWIGQNMSWAEIHEAATLKYCRVRLHS